MTGPIIARCPCAASHITSPKRATVAVVCYCTDCQAAGRALAALPENIGVMQGDGGTPLALFPKKKLQIHDDRGALRAHKLHPKSPTRRLVCSQCNSMLALDFTKGPWLSVPIARCLAPKPMANMRIMTRSRPSGQADLADDMKNFANFPKRLVFPLTLNWVAGGFATPKLPAFPPLKMP
tara:strand:- start:39 stop:578 length:540 start_codon:yes stop_codon:yes gene_type:complete